MAYAQSFALLKAASDHHGSDLRPGELATIWRGGRIIPARFLDRGREAHAEHPDVGDLALVPAFTEALARHDGYRRARLPAYLIQVQRDHFEAHTCEPLDRPATFHSDWSAR